MMFDVPPDVANEAEWGLWARAIHHRGGTHVGYKTAMMLVFPKFRSKISLAKVRHINRYFARHEVDKRAKGWRKGEPGYPSAGRIAWALWGGYPAWLWTDKILRRYGRK